MGVGKQITRKTSADLSSNNKKKERVIIAEG